ncbi:hypothetical protein NEF87_000385 [Candidatus Lokiarchaeum ossiferum]|uniref:CDP-archaeol synthase n=1 Tax=Candidatus Lokiarchaeum ossiferum TaxID=2951803 RepID=A0ABY6HKQ9_9ARCH|nr:hypothetical protein NEF87_000385 [Candidatus Lokiarchaeum sp. B-35]
MRRIKDDPNINPKDLRKETIFVASSAIILFIFLLIWSIIYTFIDAIVVMGLGFFMLVPAFVTNGMMVLAGKIKGIKSYPMDGGRYYKDGKRILGDGKTWNGFIGGWILGFVVSSIICWWFLNRIGEAQVYDNFKLIDQDYVLSFLDLIMNDDNHVNYPMYFLSQAVIALGSPIGDAIGSFIKRRTSLERGEVFLFWDQNDFVIVSSALALFFFPLRWYYWVFLLLITPLLTALANWVGYLINKKDVPW